MTHLKHFRLTRSFLAGIGISALSSLACAESIEVRVASASDDQEERLTGRRFPVGFLGSRSSDLELGAASDDQVASMPQAVGMRFRRIDIPPGATINSAAIQFTVDEPGSLDTTVQIYGELSPNPRTFSTNSFNITSRPQTASLVEWNDIPAWTSVGDAGPAQMSPDLSTIVQEIIDQPDWAANNAMAFVATVTPENYGGQRVAMAYDGNPRGAPLLKIDFTPEPTILAGDYNNNGTVEQADLDLVLLHWGSNEVPDTWLADLPTGAIDQEELDKVLLAWSDTSPVVASASAVPEPSTSLLLIGVLAAAFALHGRIPFC